MVILKPLQSQLEKNKIINPNRKTPRVHLFSLLVLLLCIMQNTMTYAEVTASTERTVLSIDETIALQIKSENGSGFPDFTGLETNFQILGRSESQNYSIINGHSSRTQIWNVTLLPKSTGELTIPAIPVGDESTKPIHLVIQKQSTTPGVDGKEVFLQIQLADKNTQTSSKDYYVQQQIMISIQLFHRIRFANATLSDLDLNNTVVEKLGNDARYSKVIGKHRYNVIEQRYAIYPQQSGELIFPSLTFTGNAEVSQNFSLFSTPGRQIISRTKPFKLNILPIPSTYTGKHWLPAESLEIESEIIENPQQIFSGEAITRHIVVRATNLLSTQLPAITVSSSSKIKTYPDKEKLSTQMVSGKIIGSRRDTIAIIPLKAGPFTLPEVKIDWWNTQTNQQETTLLAAQTLLAQENPDLFTNIPAPQNKIDTSSSKNAIEKAESLSETNGISAENNESSTSNESSTNKKTFLTDKIIEKKVYKELTLKQNIWFWISMALLLFCIILLIILFFIIAKNKKTAIAAQKVKTQERNHYQTLLHRAYNACIENDAHQARTFLIQWAQSKFNQPMLNSLFEVTELVNNEHLTNAVTDLEKSQYSAEQQHWDGKALSSAIIHLINQSKSQSQQKRTSDVEVFSPLNPS